MFQWLQHGLCQWILNFVESKKDISIVRITQKDCLSCFFWITRITLIQKGGLCTLITPSNDIVLSVCAALGLSTRKQLNRGVSLKEYKIKWKMKITEKKTKIYLETLVVLWIKRNGVEELKQKEFKDVIPIMHCRNSSWIMGQGLMKNG